LQELDEENGEAEVVKYTDDTATDKEPSWEEGLRPEFNSGKQLVEWLKRKLPYLEVCRYYQKLFPWKDTSSEKKPYVNFQIKFQPFAPDDAVHYCFKREWSKQKFEPQLDDVVVIFYYYYTIYDSVLSLL
jgi:hypothetical protein